MTELPEDPAAPNGGPALPAEVVATLAHIAGGERGPAWAGFDETGRVLDAGGALAAYGLAGVAPGVELARAAEWLEGLIVSPLRPLTLPSLAVAGRHVDLYVWPAALTPPHGYLVVVDSSSRVRERADVLEWANEASLLRQRLESAERGRRGARRERDETLNALGAEILERGPDGKFRPQGVPPAWLCAVCEWEDGAECALSGDDPASFLGAFLGDVEEVLDAGSPAVVRSGMWSQEFGGRDQVFEAVAMVLSTGRRVVMVEHIELRHRERQELLQRAREASLTYEAARRAREHKEVLLNCIVHDLRSPLASMAGALRLLRGSTVPEPQRAELLDIALRQSERQDELIRAVLEVFRGELEDVERFEEDARSAPDLALVVRECVERARPAFQERGVTLGTSSYAAPHVGPASTSRTAASLPVVGSRDRLERVVHNLLDNALRHSPAGGAVEVRVDAGPNGPELVVADRGAGVPETLRGMLFQRFVRGTVGGAAGLGLYFCRMTVERWGGRITYRDREGGGAEFCVQLRAARTLSSPAPEDPGRPSGPGGLSPVRDPL